MMLTLCQALAITQEHHRRRAHDLNDWIDDAENMDIRRRRVTIARADEMLWIGIINWLAGDGDAPDHVACLDAARQAAYKAVRAISPSCGGDAEHADKEHLHSLVHLWMYLLRMPELRTMQPDQRRDLDDKRITTITSWEKAA